MRMAAPTESRAWARGAAEQNLHTPTPHMRKASFFLREESPLICLSVGRVVDVQQSDRRGVARGRGRQRGLAQLLGALQVPRVAQRGLDVGREGTWLGHRVGGRVQVRVRVRVRVTVRVRVRVRARVRVRVRVSEGTERHALAVDDRLRAPAQLARPVPARALVDAFPAGLTVCRLEAQPLPRREGHHIRVRGVR